MEYLRPTLLRYVFLLLGVLSASLPSHTLADTDAPASTFSSDLTIAEFSCGIAPGVSFKPEDGFSQGNALMMLLATRLTKMNACGNCGDQWRKWGFPLSGTIVDYRTSTTADIASNGQFHVVAFRGTTTRQDYLSNALFGLHAFGPPTSGVHFGFWQGYKSVSARVEDSLQRLGMDKPVYFIGHSRGAAMATLQALHWQELGGQVGGIFAFAQPRLGNAAFNQWLQDMLGDRYYRYNFAGDITPHVPPLADAIPELRQRRIVSGFLARTLQIMSYAPAQGTGLVIEADGTVRAEGDPLLHELDYWQGVADTVKRGNPLTSIGGLFSSFPRNHDMDQQICAISRHLKGS